ncbi:MAG: ferritin family protein [Proteobacteria bacterium]|nr:ferritin family protein [Pseudomonadota bacterium]
MSSTSEKTIQSIEVALSNETRERDFYLLHSRRTSNSFGRLMFATLAQDENEHYQRLLVLHEKLSKEGKWPETVPLEVKNSNLKNVLKDFLNTAEKAPSAEIDDKEAIKIAIDFEEKGHRFYSGLRDAVEDAAQKRFFTILADMEMEHYLSLKETIVYFEDPAAWFADHEKPHLDGG